MRKLLRKPSPATILACLALFVASTGTSIAASHYLITSTKQIKPSVLAKLHGAKGAKGATGTAGAAGAAGATNVVTRYATGGSYTNYSDTTASCAAGEVATGGGVDWTSTDSAFGYVVASRPVANGSGVPYAWYGYVYNANYGYYSGSVDAYVYVNCASP